MDDRLCHPDGRCGSYDLSGQVKCVTLAIIDARKLAERSETSAPRRQALLSYETEMRPHAEGVLRANRGKGPDAVMQMVEDRCGGVLMISKRLSPAPIWPHMLSTTSA